MLNDNVHMGIDLLLDGYLARCFGSGAAERFFRSFPGVPPHPEPIPATYDEGSCAFYLQNGSSYGLRDPLDYAVNNTRGVVVHQTAWTSPTLFGAEREQLTASRAHLAPTKFFVNVDGSIGLSISDAIANRGYTLKGCNAAVSFGASFPPYVTLHIQWPGYPSWTTQLSTTDDGRGGGITLAECARRLGLAVDAFLVQHVAKRSSKSEWRIGVGGITRGDVVLIGLVEVYKGLWMPVLQLCRHIIG